MRIHYKSNLFIMILFFVIIVLSGYSYFGRIDSAKNGQIMNLALVENLLRSTEQTSTYKLISESIMTGLCWRAHDGSREGVFKDVNAGMAQWRELPPDISAFGMFGKSAAVTDYDYVNLSHELEKLSFEATDYTVTAEKAEMTGILKIAGHSQRVVLDVDMHDIDTRASQQDLVSLSAVTEINMDDFSDTHVDSDRRPVKLCLTMQVAKNIDIHAPYSDKPLQLSHYY